jgi:nucleoside-diphosphate-sugar epimerase
MTSVLIAGCGYAGTALGLRLAAEGFTVYGLRRDATALPAPLRPFSADLRDPGSLAGLPTDVEVVVYAAAPDGADDASYREAYVDGPRHLIDALRRRGAVPRRFLLTSSTGVYAQAHGEWVDERSPAEPTHHSGRRILQGEEIVLGGPWPATVVRFGGIYGPGRSGLLERLRRGVASCRPGPPVYTNRIHRDDCAGALRHLLHLDSPRSVYLAVDHEPSEQCSTLRWLAAEIAAPPPRTGEAGEGRPLRSNKRCRNDRLVASGYEFRYPSFRDGYRAVLRETEDG